MFCVKLYFGDEQKTYRTFKTYLDTVDNLKPSTFVHGSDITCANPPFFIFRLSSALGVCGWQKHLSFLWRWKWQHC